MARQHAAILRDIADLGLNPRKPQHRISTDGRLAPTVPTSVVPVAEEKKPDHLKSGLVTLAEQVGPLPTSVMATSDPLPDPVPEESPEVSVVQEEIVQAIEEERIDDSKPKRRGRKNVS
jgi:hypothetical protein